MAKIIGEELKPYVIDQINTRQGNKGHGSGVFSARSADTLQYLNTKSAFVKLASGVYIKEDRIKYEGLIEANKNMSLARNYVLSGGVTRYNSKTQDQNWWVPQQRSTGNSPIDRYSGAYNVQPQIEGEFFPPQPMPGIESVDISPINRGSITKVKVMIKAYSPEQFQMLDLLYMRLGYTVLLEWGNSRYLDKSGNLQNMGYTLIEDTNNGFFVNFKEDFFEFNKRIETWREKYDGNYDAILAKVTNMHWEFDPKMGVYNIQLDLISQGDIVESFKVNSSPSKNIFENVSFNPLIFTNDGEKEEYSKPDNIISQFLQLQKYFQRRKKKAAEHQISIDTTSSNIGLKRFGNFVPIPGNGTYSTIGQFDADNIFGLYRTNSQKDKDVIYLNTIAEIDSDTYRSDNKSFYIRLGYFLQFLNEFVIPKESSTGRNFIKIDTDAYTAMYRAPYHISFDPRICIVNNDKEDINGKKYYPEIYPWTTIDPDIIRTPDPDYFTNNPCLSPDDLGYLMNVYVNFDRIQSAIDSNIDKDKVINLYGLLDTICSDINRAMGGVNNIEPIIEDNTLYLIDSSYTCNKPDTDKYLLMLYGYNQDNTQSNFVRNFSVKSEITPDLATMITIGATAGGYVKGTENTMFSKWNDGIIDRFKESFYVPNEVNENKPEDIVVKYIQDIYDNKTLAAFGYKNISGNNDGNDGKTNAALQMDDEVIEKNISTATEFYKYLNSYIQSQDIAYSSPINGFIPISLNVTMDGMSGIKIYNSINVDTRFLPKRYPENLNFIIKGISHKLSGQDWETTFQTIVTSKSVKNGKKYPYSEVKSYTDELISKYNPTPVPVAPNIVATTFAELVASNPNVLENHKVSTSPSTITKGKELMKYFQSQLGLNANQAAGLVGNFIAESGLVPDRIQGFGIITGPLSNALVPNYGYKGYGYAQWTYPSRQKALEAFIGGKDKSLTDEKNKQFVVKELKSNFGYALADLKTKTSVEDATISVMLKYENPADQSPGKIAERINYAKLLL